MGSESSIARARLVQLRATYALTANFVRKNTSAEILLETAYTRMRNVCEALDLEIMYWNRMTRRRT